MNIKSKVRMKCIPIKQRKVALDRAVDITFAEVGKVVDDWWRDVMNISSTSTRLKKLKQTLGIK